MSPAAARSRKLPDEDERDSVWKDFREMVNMTPAAISRWLETDESKKVGFKDGGDGESVGHGSGRRIVEIKRKKKPDLTEDDWRHMAKMIGYIKRHKAQGGPEKDVESSDWRFSLKNWGHDPLKA